MCTHAILNGVKYRMRKSILKLTIKLKPSSLTQVLCHTPEVKTVIPPPHLVSNHISLLILPKLATVIPFSQAAKNQRVQFELASEVENKCLNYIFAACYTYSMDSLRNCHRRIIIVMIIIIIIFHLTRMQRCMHSCTLINIEIAMP